MAKSNDRLYQKKQGGTYYGWYYLPNGTLRYVCTRQRDRRAAALALRRIEREAQAASDGSTHPTPVARLEDVLAAFIEYTREIKRRSEFTVRSYEQKAGHLLRVFGADVDANKFPPEVEALLVRQRRAEGAHDHSIQKELIVLRGALKLAKRRGTFVGDLERLRTDHSPNYEPRRRFLSEEEFTKLLDALSAKRRFTVAFIVYTACRASEWGRVERCHVDHWAVLTIPGTKTKRAYRKLPLREHHNLAGLIQAVLADLPPTEDRLFPAWSNIRRDLHEACDRASINRVSPNDLRRTFATWCWHGGMDASRIALLLGHRDSRMVERVYGVLDPVKLGKDIERVFSNLSLPNVDRIRAGSGSPPSEEPPTDPTIH